LEEKDQPVAVPAEMVHSHWELWGWADPSAEVPEPVQAQTSRSDCPDLAAEPPEMAWGMAAAPAGQQK